MHNDHDSSICGVTEGNILPNRLRNRVNEETVDIGAALVAAADEPGSFSEAMSSDQREFWRRKINHYRYA